MIIDLMAIIGYSIGGHQWLLVSIILVVIRLIIISSCSIGGHWWNYFINDYWWIFYWWLFL
jgi:hypothetical protein